VTDDYLRIYLNDHLGGATAGVNLAERIRDNNEGTPLGDEFASLVREIEEDRDELQRLMDALDISRNPIKQAGAYLVERLSQLKANGKITGYSPLSRLVELEMMFLGVTGKREMWRALREVFGPRLRDFDFDRLVERAERQRERIAEHRLAAAREAFGSSGIVESWNAAAAASS
jgi:hypothetical protein